MASITKIFKNVRIIWRNFSGTPGPYNQPIGTDSHGNPVGKRTVNIVLTPEMAEDLRNVELMGDGGKMIKGCNVKTRLPQNGDGDPLYTLKVQFGKYPPEAIWRVIPKGRMALNIDNVGVLDHEAIDHADVKVVLSTYQNGTNIGISAYLNKLIAYIQEDDFDSDEAFGDIPVIGTGAEDFGSEPAEDDLPF